VDLTNQELAVERPSTIAAAFGGRLPFYRAIDAVFPGQVDRLFSCDCRNGGRSPISMAIMLGTSITRHIFGMAGRFVAADPDNVAVIFAIALVPIIGMVGAGRCKSR
jgi:hypothetical protein